MNENEFPASGWGSWAEFHRRHNEKAESSNPGVIGVHCSPKHSVANDIIRRGCADCMTTFREWLSRNRVAVTGPMTVSEAGDLMAAR